MSSYNVRKILQDRWGFLWIATQDGISRFDGRNFINYTKSGPPKTRLCGTDVRDVIDDTVKNLLWVLPTGAGFNAINSLTGEVTRTVTIPNLGRDDYNLSLLKCGGELWIGTSTGVHVYNIDGNKFGQNLSLPGGKSNTIAFAARSLLQDENGNVWVCYGGYGIVIYHPSTKAVLKTVKLAELNDQKKLNEIRISQGVFLREGEVLFATGQGLRKVYYDKAYRLTVINTPCRALPVLNRENVDWITRDTGKALLVSGYGGLYRFTPALDNYQTIKEAARGYEGDWLSSVLCMYKDRSGNTWLGCQEGLGFIGRPRSPFKPYSHDPTLTIKLDHVFAVSPVGNNRILVGLRNGVVEINEGTGEYLRFDTGHLYQHIFTDKKGRIHVSRPDGLFIYNKGVIVPVAKIYPEFDSFASYSINSHLFVSDTLIILGTENNKGLLLWNPVKKWVHALDAESGLPRLASNIVNNIYRDGRGRLWVLSDNVITVLSPGLQSAKEVQLREGETGSQYRLFFDMCEAAGSYWIASYGSGILQVDEDFRVRKVFNTQNRLSNDGVYQIYALPDNHLLVTSNNGLSQINLATSKISRYYADDGLHSNAFEEVSGTLKDGKIYAGGVNGFTVIDPKKFSDNTTPPQLYFTGAEMRTADNYTFDTSSLLMNEMAVPANVLQTTIRFAGLNYPNPKRTEYAYRIAEESPKWIANGTQSFVPFISHAPGHYTLEIKAVNEGDVWSKPVQLRIYFQPKWFQTGWFKVLLGGLALALVYGLYRYRIRQLQREHAIRQRLASDLHDDLGSTMNSVNVYASLAIMEAGAGRYLTHIKESAQEAMAAIRDIIWILDDKKDTPAQLVERLYHFAYPLCEAAGIAFQQNVAESLNGTVLEKEEKRNLYMILKEAVNNSVKYAGAKTISLLFFSEKGKLRIRFADDGCGFDPLAVKRGNGLGNMERRAAEIKYACTLESGLGNGTVIALRKK